MAIPYIRLNTADRLTVSFDEIGEQNSWLQYRLIHCNADWTRSRLVESEYIDGFNVTDIEDFAYSENTFVHYVNYRIELPNPEAPLLHSGNYLLQVFDRDRPEETLLQVRLMVSEELAGIAATAGSRTDRGHNTEWQQLDIAADLFGLQNANPYQDLELQIMQNGNESTRRTIRTPMRRQGEMLIYQHAPELVFPAGNEYRRFESVSNAFAGIGVDSLRFGGSNYHVWLHPAQGRALRAYSYDRTQHGRFLVREYNATDSDLGADYITVHFSFNHPLIKDADVYVDGEMTHGRFNASNRMVYDPASEAYRLEMPLKQGAYNYRYVTLPKGKAGALPSADLTEGNKYETENEYWIALYYHPPGSRGDRLVGVTQIYSN